MKLNRRTFLGTASAAATLGAPTILRAQPSEYVLGASLPLTGPFATAGALIAPVLTMVQELTNANGGIGGVPLRVVTDDSGYIPQNALANYQRLLATEGDKVVGYYGDSTGFMKLVAPELTGANARLMASTSFASELANPEQNPYQFLSGPTYEDQFDILLQNIVAQGGSSVAFIHSDTEFGEDPIEHGREVAEELGLEVVLVEATKPQGADIPTHVTKLAQSNAEFAILQGYVTGVWPQLIGGARQFGLPTQFMGTFWGMEGLIANRVTAEAGPFLDGYQGVMPYRYWDEADQAPRYQEFAGFMSQAFVGTPLENYMPTWGLQALCGLDIMIRSMRDTAEAGKELTADNLVETMDGIENYDMGGYFGGPVASLASHKIGTGRVYQYSAETTSFAPVSDWFNV
ncbi:MAG: ABC transporter substrate-binding protein [Pseudomonadota bacterium]